MEEKVEGENLDIDEDILLIDVSDHKEINSTFISYISLIDLSCMSFKNVKVSGLDFNVSNFTGVDIRSSNFTECRMDFVILNDAITDDGTILPKEKFIKY